MESNLHQNISELARGTYENCLFENCNFENSQFNHLIFIDCTFKDCNLSNVSLTQTSFREVSFLNCKMIGLHFENCMPFLFAVSFAKCQLNLSSFYKVNLKKTTFTNCELKEVDFTSANLAEAYLAECDCQLAVFDAVYYGGDCNSGSKTIAVNLPNDETLQKYFGTRRSQLKNTMKAKFEEMVMPISKILIDPAQQ